MHAYLIHTCIHYLYTYIRTYTYIYAYIHTHIHTYMHACMHTCMHVHAYMHTCMHTYSEWARHRTGACQRRPKSTPDPERVRAINRRWTIQLFRFIRGFFHLQTGAGPAARDEEHVDRPVPARPRRVQVRATAGAGGLTPAHS